MITVPDAASGNLRDEDLLGSIFARSSNRDRMAHVWSQDVGVAARPMTDVVGRCLYPLRSLCEIGIDAAETSK